MNQAAFIRLLIIYGIMGGFLLIAGIFGIACGWSDAQAEILLVTAFHGVKEKPDMPWEIDREGLDRIIRNFRRHGFEALPPGKFDEWRSGLIHGGRRFIMTFDDGLKTSGEYIRLIKKEFGIDSALFIVTDFLGKPGYLSRDEVAALASEGTLIGLHGKRHVEVPLLIASGTDMVIELSEARKDLETLIGKPVTWYAYPFGEYNASASAAVASAGLAFAFTIEGHDLYRSDKTMALPRLMYLRGAEKSGEPFIEDWFPPPQARTGGLTMILGFFVCLLGARFLLRARLIWLQWGKK
ncbi:MAG: polysaccharide deacetylase family protein [Candidatus Riflebacteria bacterium]|nr:polysaccharide deacetylase family protein [Candidatus Riflebacteria bacterium]